jgi:hypothetical protein
MQAAAPWPSTPTASASEVEDLRLALRNLQQQLAETLVRIEELEKRR